LARQQSRLANPEEVPALVHSVIEGIEHLLEYAGKVAAAKSMLSSSRALVRQLIAEPQPYSPSHELQITQAQQRDAELLQSLRDIIREQGEVVRQWGRMGTTASLRNVRQSANGSGSAAAPELRPVVQHIPWSELLPDEYPVGAGGFGSVFHAKRSPQGLDVAVKKLRAFDSVSAAERARALAAFQNEASLLFSVRHPNVVQPWGYSQDEKGSLWLVMEWMDGGSLDALLHGVQRPNGTSATGKRAALTFDRLVDLALQCISFANAATTERVRINMGEEPFRYQPSTLPNKTSDSQRCNIM
jgi:hypothetical protein